ncbi:helicase RepA family protein [Paracoccus sp. S4493]|uniref:helicase RepA family protein n=1 Tax=Paracoccus sp. S4493 TaxID=579490 RepID=UPI000697ED6D|nr:helicase RepA family protein [Paracoccus sp. S4493]
MAQDMTPDDWEAVWQAQQEAPARDHWSDRHRHMTQLGASLECDGAEVRGAMINNGPLLSINPKPFVYRAPSKLPPREWLYGHHLCRQYASATIAPGGVGKTTLTVTDALAMATGRTLIGLKPHCPLRVWLWNGEDPTVELERRMIAAMEFHGIGPEDVDGRLFIDSGRDMPIKIGQATPAGPMIAEPVVSALIEALRSRKIDVLIVDPFVSVHSMPENDNGAMDAAVKAFALIADRTGCAIDLVHHSRKLNGADADIDAARGGSAIAGAVRAARVLNVMNTETAEVFGISGDERRSYVRVDDAKANLAPASAARWFRLSGQALGNSTDDRPEDFVAVADSWTPPDTFDGITVADLLRVQNAIDQKALRENVQANEWAGYVIGPLLDLDPNDKTDKARIKRMIKTWISTGALKIERVQDGKGHDRPVIAVGEWAVED